MSFIRASREPGVTLGLVPFALDQTTSLRMARTALEKRLVPGEKLDELLPPLESAIRSAHATGGLVRSNGETIGISVWETSGPLGVAVRLLYLAPPHGTTDTYGQLLDLVEHAAGPVAFAPGPLDGLSTDEEGSVMRARGYEGYGRSEMTLAPTTPVPVVPPPAGAHVRAVRPEDEPALARLHEAAYRDHLDRYLALEEMDPVRDAGRQVRGYFTGRWGPLLSPGSSVSIVEGGVVAAALSVERSGPPLILDVMSDPAFRGRGFAWAALTDAVRSLRARGFSAVVLNVTEGNAPAISLYRRVGFSRSIGPSFEWYRASRMAVTYPPPYSGSAATGDGGAGAR